jgi:hypothetical protein
MITGNIKKHYESYWTATPAAVMYGISANIIQTSNNASKILL